MNTLQKFSGLNNISLPEELAPTELAVASNVDIDISGRARRRVGYTQDSVTKHANVWDAGAFTLATRGVFGDLVNLDTNTVLVAALGHTPRLWFHNLPDGRVVYTNGVTSGLVSAAAATGWGVPLPATLGVAADMAGALYPGKYQWSLTHVRLSDGLEGGPAYSAGSIDVVSGGISLTGIPVLAGHRTNVYLTSANGGERFYAGNTVGSTFAYTAENTNLIRPCRTDFMQPPPAGKLVSFWRGRTLVAVGSALFASRPNGWELFDLRRDFKQFSAPITMVAPVDRGIWVGTDKELSFLAGEKWDALVRIPKINGPVVLGSGVVAPGIHVKGADARKGREDGDCMVCVADGWLVAGTPSGELVPMSTDRYRVEAAEVAATFRMNDDVPQYVAIEL